MLQLLFELGSAVSVEEGPDSPVRDDLARQFPRLGFLPLRAILEFPTTPTSAFATPVGRVQGLENSVHLGFGSEVIMRRLGQVLGRARVLLHEHHPLGVAHLGREAGRYAPLQVLSGNPPPL